MRYTLVIVPVANNDLAEAWMKAADRGAVATAADRIEQLLRTRADQVGEPVGSFRRLIELPLEAMYEIMLDGYRVRIFRFELVE